MKTRLLATVLVVGVALVGPALAQKETRGVTPTEIVLGMHTDLSGPAATYGVSSSNAVKMRFDEANERGGEDNITVIIARFDGEALYSASEGGSITGSFRALNSGYSSDYFTGAATSTASPAEDESPEAEQKQITKMLNVADLARFGSADPIEPSPENAAQVQNPPSPPAIRRRASFSPT